VPAVDFDQNQGARIIYPALGHPMHTILHNAAEGPSVIFETLLAQYHKDAHVTVQSQKITPMCPSPTNHNRKDKTANKAPEKSK
jgi:hypothetical protein